MVDYVAPGGLGSGWTIERARELPANSLVPRNCGEDGVWLRSAGEQPHSLSDFRLTCPGTLGPDGGACE
ncbi:MAG: hypothetical protein M3Y87_09665 [Myxococcota bacterium]|nr:hypothetical protein [Myxococcota bacterium]